MSDTENLLEGTSLQSFISSLVLNFVSFAVFLILFIILRTRLHRIYEPRAYIEDLQKEKRMKRLPRKPWGWIAPVYRTFNDKDFIIEKSGIDCYFFIRFLRMVVIIFLPALLLVWPILLPINIVDGVNDNPLAGQTAVTGLDRLAFGNVSRAHTSRYWAHLVLAYAFVIWICIVTCYEMIHFVKVRQEWLVSKRHKAKASATTVLITTIPKPFLDEQKLRDLFSVLPGGVKNVWLNRDFSNLLVDINKRDGIAHQLELAELNLLQKARKTNQKRLAQQDSTNTTTDHPTGGDLAPLDPVSEKSAAHKYVVDSDRPQHRLPIASWFVSLPNWLFLGKKVDTIRWCQEELLRMNVEIEGKQGDPAQFKPMNSAFIQFHKQVAAHMAVQSVAHHHLKAMTPRYLEVSPGDVLWNNMQMHWWERYIWIAVVWAIVIAASIFFAIPTAFIGTLSHITDLVALAPWLGFLNTNKPGAKFWSGLITGVLPPALLGLLLLLVPILMKLAARMQGHPTRKEVSLRVQNMYFIFLFIQLFLVITISSGITALINSAVCNACSCLIT